MFKREKSGQTFSPERWFITRSDCVSFEKLEVQIARKTFESESFRKLGQKIGSHMRTLAKTVGELHKMAWPIMIWGLEIRCYVDNKTVEVL